MWPEWLSDALGKNLLSAFLHGDCLMEGFDPFRERWLLSFLLEDDSPSAIAPLQDLTRKADTDKISFGYFFTEKFFETAEDVFPMEFLHIANKNCPIVGEAPLVGFTPSRAALRIQCERELRGVLLRLRGSFVYRLRKKTSLDFFFEAEREILPLLYTVHYLKTGVYPKERNEVLAEYPFAIIEAPGASDEIVSSRAESYILSLQEVLQDVDRMEV